MTYLSRNQNVREIQSLPHCGKLRTKQEEHSSTSSKPAINRKRSSLRTIVDHLSCPAVPASRMDTAASSLAAPTTVPPIAADPINSILQ